MEYNIRTIQSVHDISAMTTHRINYLKELQGNMSPDYETQLSNELLSYFIEAITNGSFYALLLEYEGNIASFGAMLFKKVPGDINKSCYLEADILNMYTLQQYRNRGLSSLILESLIAHAKELGVSKLSLHTSIAGERLYRKYGFTDPLYPVLERFEL